jgi:hypothetical protein
VDGHEDTEASHDGHQGGPAVADQGQGDADYRKQPGDHAHVDEQIDEEHQDERAAEQSAVGVLGLGGDIQPPQYDEQIQGQQAQHTRQAQLFGEHREDEVGGSLGQKLQV